MPDIHLRSMRPEDWPEVADLIYISVNHYYQSHGMPAIFSGGPAATLPFCSIYESLDPGCCIIAQHNATHRLMGSCFYHPRETHISLGIMTVHPAYFGRGVAGRLLKHITDLADQQKLPVRLVSSALNLDSYSLYNRNGFVPREIYQDIILDVPLAGLGALPASNGLLRDAGPNDVDAIAEIEMHISAISRRKDYQFFIENRSRQWHVSVIEGVDGNLGGYLVSHKTGSSSTIGPGLARDASAVIALLHRELNHVRGTRALVLAPAAYPDIVRQMYAWGGKNVEIHFAQVRGNYQPFRGPTLPTFMPETG